VRSLFFRVRVRPTLQATFLFKPVFAPLLSIAGGGTGFPAFLGLSFYWAPQCSVCFPGMHNCCW
jgi:hypothetical protein